MSHIRDGVTERRRPHVEILEKLLLFYGQKRNETSKFVPAQTNTVGPNRVDKKRGRGIIVASRKQSKLSVLFYPGTLLKPIWGQNKHRSDYFSYLFALLWLFIRKAHTHSLSHLHALTHTHSLSLAHTHPHWHTHTRTHALYTCCNKHLSTATSWVMLGWSKMTFY